MYSNIENIDDINNVDDVEIQEDTVNELEDDESDKNIKSLMGKDPYVLLSGKNPKTEWIKNEEKTDKQRMEEWKYVESLVMEFKKQFLPECTVEQEEKSKKAGENLLNSFYPLIRKYTLLLKTGQIDFKDKEQKSFISLFINEIELKRALGRKKQTAGIRERIYYKFNFIKETYGSTDEKDIIIDLQMLVLNLAKRYKQKNKNFCGYLFNTYKYEVFRHIQSFTMNPLNISYRNIGYEDYMKTTTEEAIEEDTFENSKYEDNVGIPDFEWVSGETCSDKFKELTPIERKIIIKYYMEECNDRQIADELGIHINTVNQKRRQATEKLANVFGMEKQDVIRKRQSGLKTITPIHNA